MENYSDELPTSLNERYSRQNSVDNVPNKEMIIPSDNLISTNKENALDYEFKKQINLKFAHNIYISTHPMASTTKWENKE